MAEQKMTPADLLKAAEEARDAAIKAGDPVATAHASAALDAAGQVVQNTQTNP